MYKLLILISFTFVSLHVLGQNDSAVSMKKHKIIFQMASKDTSDHSSLMRQLINLKKLAPKSQLEVVIGPPN